MFEILPAPDHVAAYRLSGILTEADLDGVIADIEDRLTRHEKLGILADLTGFEDMTFRAGLRDARYGLSMIRQLKRFPREAVVTDKGWIESLIGIANPIIPHVEVKSFKPAEFDAALAWATEIEGGPEA
ncbi:STAS/SEC14 domain-containing protein [Bosea lathyri]|uniref:SpoIIAA-like n=1 Tax=Bosea lathyri TaxID=1036778 RepID=A0A1H6AW40_9HYPH|nr:STAS/SEC14 domain-containing protein [Bosea lathyri]SEG52878.1 SpoIIAA-like [Bosea lathyri]